MVTLVSALVLHGKTLFEKLKTTGAISQTDLWRITPLSSTGRNFYDLSGLSLPSRHDAMTYKYDCENVSAVTAE